MNDKSCFELWRAANGCHDRKKWMWSCSWIWAVTDGVSWCYSGSESAALNYSWTVNTLDASIFVQSRWPTDSSTILAQADTNRVQLLVRHLGSPITCCSIDPGSFEREAMVKLCLVFESVPNLLSNKVNCNPRFFAETSQIGVFWWIKFVHIGSHTYR